MLQTRRSDHAARVGAALCVSLGAFMLTSMPGAGRLFGVFIYPLTAICATHPVWFWLFCAALFSDRLKLDRGHVLAVAAMALAGVLYQTLVSPAADGVSPALVRTLGIGFGAASLAFIGLGVLAIRAGRHSDLDERRRRIRAWVAPAVSAYLAAVVVVQAWVTLAGQSTPKPLVLLNLAIINGLATLALASFVKIRVLNWLDFTDQPTPDAAALTHLERSVLDRLDRRLLPEKLSCTRGSDHRGTGGASRHAGARPAPGDQPGPRVPKLQRLPAHSSTAGSERPPPRSGRRSHPRAHDRVGRWLRIDRAVQPGIQGALRNDADRVPAGICRRRRARCRNRRAANTRRAAVNPSPIPGIGNRSFGIGESCGSPHATLAAWSRPDAGIRACIVTRRFT